MPIHDWTKVRANRFHDFHQGWTIAIRNALNRGILPEGFFALAEQRTEGPEPDVVALSSGPGASGGLTVQESPVKTRIRMQTDAGAYANKANRIAIYHPDGIVVAIIESVSPGNKESRHAINSFLRKINEFIEQGVHVLLVDLFPPPKRDPQGVHQLVWNEWTEESDFALPSGKPLTLVSYCAGEDLVAYVEPAAVGEPIKDMPVFLAMDRYVNCPLAATYQESWDVFPKALKEPLEASIT